MAMSGSDAKGENLEEAKPRRGSGRNKG